MRAIVTTSAEATSPDRFGTLDALRGIAALVVAAEHLRGNGPFFSLTFFENGLLFVDFFFVLSGFVIAASYGERLAQGFSSARFLWLRFWRIWPVHALILFAYLGVELVVLWGADGLTGRAAFGPERAPWQFIVHFFLAQSFIVSALYSWVLQSWSISVEVVMYLFTALIFTRLRQFAALAWLVLAVAASIVMHVYPEEIGLYHKLLRGFSGFGYGVVAYAVWQRWGSRIAAMPGRLASGLEVLAVLMIITAVQTAEYESVFGLYGIGFAITVLIFAAARGFVSHALLRPVPVFLGTVSYSIYMTHTLIESGTTSAAAAMARALGHGALFVTRPGSNRPGMGAEWGLVGDLFSIAVLVVVVAVAAVTYWLVENPVRQWSRRTGI